MAAASGERRGGIFYGWWIVVVVTLACSISYMAYVYAFGAFFRPMLKELGWTRAEVAGGMTAGGLFYAWIAPLIGALVDRFGGRIFIWIGNGMLGLGLVMLQLVDTHWKFYAIYGLLVGLGASIGTYTAIQPILVNWFIGRRSLALGLLAIGGGSGLVYGPLWATFLIDSVGWRMAFTINGIVVWLISMALTGLVARSRPEPMGLSPYPAPTIAGGSSETPAARPRGRFAPFITTVEWPLRPIFRTWAFYGFIIGYSSFFGMQIILAHQIIHLTDIGITRAMAAGALGLVGIFSLLGRITWGVLGDRIEPRYLYTISLILAGLGYVIFSQARTVTWLFPYAILFGWGYGSLIPMQAALFANYYGRNNFAKVRGFNILATSTIGALGPVYAGWIYDMQGSYDIAFWTAIIWYGIGAVCIFLSRPPRPSWLEQASGAS